MFLGIKQRRAGSGGRMGIVAVHTINPLHGKAGVLGLKARRIDLVTLQADFSFRKLQHKFVILRMRIVTVTALPLPDRRVKLLRFESFSQILMTTQTQVLLGVFQQKLMLPGVFFVTAETLFFLERAVNRGHGKALFLIRMTLEAQLRDLFFYHQLLISRMRIVAGCTLGLRRKVHKLVFQDVLEIRVTREA
jgi:hypothetical protein